MNGVGLVCSPSWPPVPGSGSMLPLHTWIGPWAPCTLGSGLRSLHWFCPDPCIRIRAQRCMLPLPTPICLDWGPWSPASPLPSPRHWDQGPKAAPPPHTRIGAWRPAPSPRSFMCLEHAPAPLMVFTLLCTPRLTVANR